ncbi:MAG: hypothetical protein CBC65_010460 [Rhodothermaceae bacterium TMED105]|mgnify:FL=1|nr:MAG: hypothetical protein CBC65_010640 [Rhodothermaceae bacterium TMED105]RPF78458.1 MAG: hypothetical protein CBC65_010460 [Rhodothermaceae bacterium TMED105]|tara:strand:- start:216 stop:569 length:354 start_codon:yes stop_codon:yes gene_type:complete
MFWFEKQSYKDFHAQLLSEVVGRNDNENIKWVNTSYNNDTTGSIGVDVCIDTETFVQLFAFETDEDAKVEGLDRYMVYVSVDGEESYTGFFPDRDEAIKDAIARAKQLNAEYIPNVS